MGGVIERGRRPAGWALVVEGALEAAAHRCVRCGCRGRLTVHQMDGNLGNTRWWNLLVLCGGCRKEVAAKVDPEVPFLAGHAAWMKPYMAGFYAKKYEGREVSRRTAERQLERLLGHELQLEGGAGVIGG